MSGGEMERWVKLDRLPPETAIEADAAERAALARRFGLPAIERLSARLTLTEAGDAVEARGRLEARFTQHCAIADTPFANSIEELLAFRFVPALAPADEDEELEFAAEAPDEIEYSGAAFDLGEAVAQSFGLALDPYATGPDAEAARRSAGLADDGAPSGPFAALAALKGKA